MRPSFLLAVTAVAAGNLCDALSLGGRPASLIRDDRNSTGPLQKIVTWDDQSLFINGKRVMLFSGEIHPYRLPVPSLWIDVLEKIKALGLNAVSVYLNWAQLEGKPGDFSAEGIFDYAAFFDAAKEAGLYVIARPGPYINAEVSGGGFPGWIQRVKGHLRTADQDFLAATDNYMANIARIIADAQITNGGPVILYQPENEYSQAKGLSFPDPDYFQYVIDQALKAGIVVPLLSNDASPNGYNAPGTGKGSVDIYGHDGYPLGFDCANPEQWNRSSLPPNWRSLHLQQSPSTPYSIPEFQGGSFDPWGGWGFDQCERLTNHEQVRVFYKNNYAAGVTIFNLYMIFGGTNWGNLGHPGGYTSYDYAAAIREDRRVDREKYSELKLEAQFLKASPGYLTATPGNSTTTGKYSSSNDVAITALTGTNGSFFVVRHTDYQSIDSTSYTLDLPTSNGSVKVPQLGGSLTLGRRDSKIHVTDYPVGDTALLYSTAEIFTWQKFEDKTVLIVYGGPGELHELAIKSPPSPSAGNHSTGTGAIKVKSINANLVAQWETKPERQVFQIGGIDIYALDRNSAYNYWVSDLVISEGPSSSLIVSGPYLVRSASISDSTLNIQADFNATAEVEIIGVPEGVARLTINHDNIEHHVNEQGNWIAKVILHRLEVDLPDLKTLDWRSIDSLPEIKARYEDSSWVSANQRTSNNSVQPQRTPVSLYASDYGFHTGALLYRGHFTAQGDETEFYISTQGGSAFGSSVWLNDKFIGSWKGTDVATSQNNTYTLPKLSGGKDYVLTVLVDNMGLNENWVVGPDEMKFPRGILDYSLRSPDGKPSDISWKLTGNLGGEDYADRARGPLNEGGLFVERQGYHQPAPPLDDDDAGFESGTTPFDGLTAPGVAFYTAELALDIPSDRWDVPLTFKFTNNTEAAGGAYRAWLYVNGFQFGRYVSNIGPQTAYPVPEGILNYGGDNWIGLAIWALESGGAKVPGLALETGSAPILTGRKEVEVVDAPAWKRRQAAY